MLIIIYNALLFFIKPFFPLYLKKRLKNSKEDPIRINEKKAIYPKKEIKQKLIWFHAVSVGETISILPLITELAKNHSIILTTSTKSSALIAKNRLPKNSFHIYAPYDFKDYVTKFLNHFKPYLAIWTESELWPNLINETKKRGIKTILINARISDKKGLKKISYNFFASKLIKKFDLILPQSKQDLNRLKELGAKNIKFIGNLKLDTKPLPYKENLYKELQSQLKNRVIFLASSTHAGEEKTIAEIHHNLRKSLKNLITIIIPRHPDRSAEISEFLKNKKLLATTIRSKKEQITSRTDIYLADTIGELGIFYKLANISFIGGSLVDIGGHNPIEALQFNNVILTGKYTENFRQIYINEAKEDVAIICNSPANLEANIYKLLTDKKLFNKKQKNSKNYLDKNQNILKDTLKIIAKYLD